MNKKEKRKESAEKPLQGSWLWGALLFCILLFVDLLTKTLADAYFSQPDTPTRIPIIPGWVNLCITYNRGISYGMGKNAPMWLKIAVIIGTAVMMLILALVYFKLDKKRTLLRIAIVFVVAGGVGNLIDRLYYQVWDPDTLYGVRDMVDISRLGFAVCNFADFFISGGSVALILGITFFDKDAIFPVGKYKVMAEEAKRLEEKKHRKETEDGQPFHLPKIE